MGRRFDAGKEAEWRRRLKRFGRSGLTVAGFCDGERVSVASFYYWRKRLGQTASGRRSRPRRGVFRQIAVMPAPSARAGTAPVAARETPGMLPVPPEMIATTRGVAPVPPEMIAITRGVAPAISAPAASSSEIVIQFPCGTRMEINGGPPDLVRAVVDEVARVRDGVQSGIRSC